MPRTRNNEEPKEKAPPKPKSIAKIDLIVYDNGQMASDFFIWDDDEIGRRKKWSVTGESLIRFLHRLQPNNLPVLASAINLQIASCGLPEELQSVRLRKGEQGNFELIHGNFIADKAPQEVVGMGDKIADQIEVTAAREIGLSPNEITAALPDNQLAQTLGGQSEGEAPAAPPIPT